MSTIIACSTPWGKGGIAVVRISGQQAKQIAKQVFAPFPSAPNMIKHGLLKCGECIDDAMCAYFDAPRSYTGEDTVEFYTHGSLGVVNALIEQCLTLGAVMAENGEFSKRAFINGKQNLSTAEGIIDVIDAESMAQVKAGVALKNNELGIKAQSMQDEVTTLLSQCEAMLDYPEEDLEQDGLVDVKTQLAKLKQDITILLDTAKKGRIIKYGAEIALVGKVNVGKSSLLNALLGEDRAIVSEKHGTTRDVVTGTIFYKDAKFNFSDTAGIRHSDEPIEQQGIKRSINAALNADLTVIVEDGQGKPDVTVKGESITVRNKCDLIADKAREKGVFYVSAVTKEGVEELKSAIYEVLHREQNISGTVLTNARHVDVFRRALVCIDNAIVATTNSTADCVAQDLKNVWLTLGEITGKTATQEVIDAIYQRFCLGK